MNSVNPQRPLLIEIEAPPGEGASEELLRGLHSARPWIAPKFFYDALGARLFGAICELPEYYLPRAEREVMDERAAEIAAVVGTGCTLIDLGAGNCEKAERLFGVLRPTQYVAVDIATDFLRERLDGVQDRHPHMQIVGLGQDFSRQLVLPPVVRCEKRLFFYPGSSIGNFTPHEATAFLGRIRDQCGGEGKLLLGVDLVKDRAALEAAYDDALGLTAAFNLNVLNVVNRIVGSDFNVRDWRHVAFFNAEESRIEMHLEAKREVAVRIPGGPRTFGAGARIHTENSYKFSAESLNRIARDAGFAPVLSLNDSATQFRVELSRPDTALRT